MSDISNNINDVVTALNNKSDIDLGNTILDPTVSENNNKPVSGASVYQEIIKLIDSAPETLDTLAKIAKAINDDPEFSKNILQQIDTKLENTVKKTGDTMTGSLSINDHSLSVNDVSIGVHVNRYDLDHTFQTPRNETTSVELVQINTNGDGSIRAGALEYQLTDTNTVKLQLITRNRKNDGWNQLGLFEDDSEIYGVAPNVSNTNDDSSKIATTHWIRTATGDTTLNANTANSSIKAEQDASGNIISDTYATKQELKQEVSNLVNQAPETLDTLQELATALGNDPNFATTISNQIGTKANDTETIHKSGNETIAGTKTFSSTISGSVSGNSGTTTKLKTARNIAISGDASGSASFDGSKNITINTTLADSGVTEGSYGPTAATTLAFGGSFNVPQITVDVKGRSTQIVNRAIKLPAAPTTITGNAGSATKLATARTINGTSFNGSANITTANWGTERNISISDNDGTNTGTAVSVNGSTNVTLKLPATIKATLSGNASTATTASKANQLTTARTIGISGAVTGTATSFNGTGNITIPITALDVSKATAGTLPIARGGTGRTDGYAVNVTEHIGLTAKDNIGYITQDDPSSNDVADRATLAWWNGAYSDANKSNLTYCANGAIVGTTGNQTIGGTKTFSSTIAGSINGNAATSTKLQTARTIDGISFNGSANISHFGTCSTAAATAAKTVALTGFTLVTGAVVFVRFTVTNTAANPTLNVNGTGAKAIQYRNAAVSAGYLAANRTYAFVYDGSSYELVGDVDTKLGISDAVNSTSSTTAASSKAAKTAYDKAVSAATSASTAQSTANSANTKATNAQTTANSALSTARTAQNTANSAGAKAECAAWSEGVKEGLSGQNLPNYGTWRVFDGGTSINLRGRTLAGGTQVAGGSRNYGIAVRIA